MAGSSNIDQIGVDLAQAIASVNFKMKGHNQSLGRDMAGIVVDGIAKRTAAEGKDSDGGALKPNEARYAAWKARRYQVDKPLIRTGQMLSNESLLGDTEVNEDSVVMMYGTGEAPVAAATGVPMTQADTEITDIEKAFFVSKDRPFYALDDEIAQQCIDEAQSVIIDHFAKL